MDWKENFKSELRNFLRVEQFIFNASMCEHTTFKIGGAADVLIFPANCSEVAKIFKLVDKYKIPCTILGNGSNVLVLDGGIRGAVIKFTDKFFGTIRADKNKIFACAGASLKDVSNFAAENSLTGMEFAVGIPGSIGGAIFMNAGAYDGEMKNIVENVKAVSPNGDVINFCRDNLNLGYRKSIFQENNFAIC